MRPARRTWCMSSLYWKTFVFVRPHVNQKPAFSNISTLQNVFEKMHLRWQNSPNTYVWTVRQTRKKIINQIRVNRALVMPYRNIMLIPGFWRENNFFVFVLFVYLSFSLELPHTTTTKVTPASKYPIKIKVYKVVPKKISDFTQI